MKKHLAAALAALLLCSCARPAPVHKKSVLLIGNSFTAANSMPAMLSDISASLGWPLEVEALTPGGSSLEQHYGDQGTLNKIKERRWDAVVLQEQSQRPAWPDRQLSRLVLPYAMKLDGAIHESNPEARTVFFATWGYKDGDKANCAAIPEVCSYEGMQKRLDAGYERLATAANAGLAPAGKAWAGVRAAHPEMELYAPDGIHPSREGSYLAACVIYAALSGKSPAGAADNGLDHSTAVILQQAAAKAAGK